MKVVDAPDITKLVTKAHENKWVAFSTDYSRIIAVADSLDALTQELDGRKAVVTKILPWGAKYVPRHRAK